MVERKRRQVYKQKIENKEKSLQVKEPGQKSHKIKIERMHVRGGGEHKVAGIECRKSDFTYHGHIDRGIGECRVTILECKNCHGRNDQRNKIRI